MEWYELVNSSDLEQGDFIDSCPFVVLTEEILEGKTVQADIEEYNVIVLTQSCDLVNAKVGIVQVCPVFALSEYEKQGGTFASKDGKEGIRRGYLPGYHMLAACELNGYESEILIADFRRAYAVDLKFLLGLVAKAGDRKRLISPFREHFSQAYARFFMRVGLPADIESFTKTTPQLPPLAQN